MFTNLSNHKRIFVCALSVLLLMGVVSVAGLNAQVVTTATIAGTVTDASGAAVAGAMITVKNTDTGVTNTSVSDNQGRYSVPALIIGTYQVDVAATGFKKYSHSGITLTVGSQIVVDAPLEVGTVAQTVTVESDVTHVETTSVAVSNLVEAKQLQDLPLNGRNYYALITLSPGVQPAIGGSTFYGNQQNYAISGGRPSGQAYLVDDTNTGDFWNHSSGNGTTGTQLGVDSIAEFQTLLNTYGAQFGGNGAAFSASTKSGTNSLHGTAYEYLLNSATSAANNFIATSAPVAKPFDNRNQFGTSLGGPIKKDKAFFFFNYEGLRETTISSSQLSEPDLTARGCQNIGLAACQAAGGVGPDAPEFLNSKGVFVNIPFAPCNAGNATAFPNSAYPGGNGCAAQENVKSMLSVFPIGTLSDNQSSGMALTQSIGNRTHNAENYFTGRADYTLSDKDSIFAKLTIDKAYSYKYGSVPLIPEHDFTTDTYATLEERRIFSPTLLNVAHLSYVRPNEQGYQNGNPTVNVPALGGSGVTAPYANCTGCTPNAPFGFFNFSPGVQGRSAYIFLGSGISINGTQPFYLIPNNFTIGDDVIWTKGSHSIKFGMNIERMDENTWAPFVTAGTTGASSNVLNPYTVSNAGVVTPGAASGITTTLAAQIAGQITTEGTSELPEFILAAQNLPPQDGTLDAREMIFSPYFQDDWKVTSRVTLNLGIRYSPTIDPLFVRHLNENLLDSPYDNAPGGGALYTTSAPSALGPNGQPSYAAGTNCLAPNALSNGGAPLTCGFVPVTHPFSTNVSLKNIDPRVGVAWDPFKDHKTSVRAGMGFYHVVIVERDYDMWIQPPALTGSATVPNTIAPGSPYTYPYLFTAPGASPLTPCVFSSQPANIAVPASLAGGGVNFGLNPAAGQYTGCLTLSAGGTTYYGASKSPYTMQYNLNVQREVLPQTIVSIGFVGNRGVDLVSQRDYNSITPCGGTDPVTGSPIYTQGFSSTINNYVACPRLNPSMSTIAALNPSVSSWYNSGQVSVNRRFHKGLQMQASYTYSKSIDIVDGSYGLDGGGTVGDPYNYQVSKGPQSNARGMVVNVSTVYQLPFKGNQLVSGWQMTGIYSFFTGAPFTVSGASRGGYGQTVDWAPNNPGCNGNVYTGISPDVAANRYLSGTNNAGQFPNGNTPSASIVNAETSSFLNPNCFSPAPAGELGNLGKNTFFGPDQWNLDASILKDTKITKISENFTLQFRAEMFNVLNHPFWGAPTASVFSACTSATCGGAGGTTTANAALGANNSTDTFGEFGNPSSTPRRMQFSLRVTF